MLTCAAALRPLLPPPAGDDGEVAEVSADGSFFCGEIRAEGLPVGEGIPSEEDLFASLNCQKGELSGRLNRRRRPLPLLALPNHSAGAYTLTRAHRRSCPPPLRACRLCVQPAGAVGRHQAAVPDGLV